MNGREGGRENSVFTAFFGGLMSILSIAIHSAGYIRKMHTEEVVIGDETTERRSASTTAKEVEH